MSGAWRRVLLGPKLDSGVWASLLSASGARSPQHILQYPVVVQRPLKRGPLPGPALGCRPGVGGVGGAGGGHIIPQSGLGLRGSMQVAKSPHSGPDHRVHPVRAHQLCNFGQMT